MLSDFCEIGLCLSLKMARWNMSLFFKADLPVIKTSCSVYRDKDYQTGTAKADGARKVGKVTDDGQTACYSQDCFKLFLLAVFLLLFLSSCQTTSPASFPFPLLIYFPSCYRNKFYCASVALQNDMLGFEKQTRTGVVISLLDPHLFSLPKPILLVVNSHRQYS